jgi:hypothetical protein
MATELTRRRGRRSCDSDWRQYRLENAMEMFALIVGIVGAVLTAIATLYSVYWAWLVQMRNAAEQRVARQEVPVESTTIVRRR